MDATPAPTPQPQSAMPPLATIGYALATPAGLVAALRAAGIELLVDVRAVPASRRPGFSKRQLAAALEEAGIAYRHMKGLGTPAAGRDAARAGRLDAFERIFREHLAGLEAQAELAELARLIAAGRRLCLLCLEAEPAHCHRAILAEELRRQLGLEVRHLAPEPPAALG
ncbi:MAG: DUF488 domain-containing protein [Geminicoccaceae bacterium]|nr:DUF488 domain-containing protein [Geminicoccaceae bacterium]MCX8100534.1 DUF488 domain-containing protein [Geminicoccaceae bacterium]MDW8369672.1 DUF488 domain-containing protein [Geminicoccaceae bacterium]